MSVLTLDYLLRRALRRHRDRVALACGARHVTYGDLDRSSNRLANALIGQGAKAGDRIATVLSNSVEFIEAELATIKAGMVKSPINPRLSPREIIRILSNIRATGVFLDEQYQEAVLDARSGLPNLKFVVVVGSTKPGAMQISELIKSSSESEIPSPTHVDDLGLMRFSGGTTGEPKGIMHSAGSLASIALSVVREYNLSSEDCFLSVAHLSHGQNFVWPALFCVGARLVLMDKFEPESVLRTIATQGITRLHMVPTMWSAVIDHPRFSEYDVSSLRNIVYASAPMPVDRIRKLIGIFGRRVTQVYTLSESAVVTTLLRPEDHVIDGPDYAVRRLASCGREALDVSVQIVDDERRPLPVHEIGELAISSPGNMMGYWEMPELTQQVLRGDWVVTGDLGYMDEEGFVFLVDRKDDKIITGALNVYPREVEEVVYSHPAVRECAVIGIPDEKWGEAIIAFVTLRPGVSCEAEDLLRHCEGRIADYKKPRSIVFLDDLPKSSVGKIARRTLREPYWKGYERFVN